MTLRPERSYLRSASAREGIVVAKKKPPEVTGKGYTGRFVPCPAARWRHPDDMIAVEVRWTAKLKQGERRVYYYFRCPECQPACQVFLNDWDDHCGLTLVEAEAEGYRPKVSRDRRAELLKELGLQQVAGPSLQPPGPWAHPRPPAAPFPGPHYAPIPPQQRPNPKPKPKKK